MWRIFTSNSNWQIKCHQCFRRTHSSAEACFCQLLVQQTLGESKGNWRVSYENQQVFHVFEAAATGRHLTTGPASPLTSLKTSIVVLLILQLWNMWPAYQCCSCQHYFPTEQTYDAKSQISWPAPLLPNHIGRGIVCKCQYPLQPECAASEQEKCNELKKLTAAWLSGEKRMPLSNKLIHYIGSCLNLFLLRQTSACIK